MLKYFVPRVSRALCRIDRNKVRECTQLSHLQIRTFHYHVPATCGRNILNVHSYNCIHFSFGASVLFCQVTGHLWTIISNVSTFSTPFRDVENGYAHSVLERNPAYSTTLFPENYLDGTEMISDDEFQHIITKDWHNESAESVFRSFKSISLYCSKKLLSLKDEMFDGLIKETVHKCPELSDDNLIGILACLKFWPGEKASSRNYAELWNVIDKQCSLRMEKWDRNKLLLVADQWYLLHLGRFSEFLRHCTVRLSRKPEKLTASQFVQCMFYINILRKFPPHTSAYDIEYGLEKCLDQLTVDELGIIAMGFFKSEKPIRSQSLLTEVMRQIINSVDTIHEITLAALLKVIRYSLQPTNADVLFVLMDKLMPNIDRLSQLCCTHIALVGTNVQLYHEGTMDKIVQRFVNEIELCRLKDLERLAFALSLYNYEHKMEPCIYKLIAEELCRSERTQEIKQYPKCLTCCLHYLSLQKIFLKEEISKVLEINFIHDVYGKNYFKVGREILSLDLTMEVECPEYSGNRLDPKIRLHLAKIYTDRIWEYKDLIGRKLSSTDRMLLEVITTAISVLGGEAKVHLAHVTPHRERADIVYGIHARGSAVDIPPVFRNLEIGTCKKPPCIPDTKWYCIVVGGWNSYIRILNKPVGNMSSKLRHLELMGYKPVVVPFFEWKHLSLEEQEKYLAKKIWEEFQEVSCAIG